MRARQYGYSQVFRSIYTFPVSKLSGIIDKGDHIFGSPSKIKTLPTSAANSTNILFYSWDNNYGVILAIDHSNPKESKMNVSFNYVVYNSNKNVVSRQNDLASLVFPYHTGARELYINMSKSLFDPKQVYTMNLEYTIYDVDPNGKEISYSGYINNIPFIPDKIMPLHY